MLPKYLDDDLLSTPSTALEAAHQEIRRLGKSVPKMVRNIMPAAITGTRGELEQIGDRIATAMVTSASKRIDEEVIVSPQTAEALTEYHAEVVSTLDDALKSFKAQDPDLAKEVRQRKKDFSEMSRSLAAHGLSRLVADEPNRLKTYAREMEVMEILKEVFAIARRIAQIKN